MTLRLATPADRSDVIALVLAEDATWSAVPEVSAEEAGEFIDQYQPGVIFERAGRAAGFAAVDEDGAGVLVADPHDVVPALEALVAWLGERGHHEVEAYANDAPRIAWLEAHGFSHRRSAFDLERGIDPPLAPAVWPNPLTVAPFRRGEENGAVHALVYVDAAFGEIPGHAQRSVDAWLAMITPEYSGWVARRDGRPVGWVAGRVYSDGRGWIQQLAVDRAERGHGLGRALLLHGLTELRAGGAVVFALGVQAANEHALGLYRGIGFEVQREWRVYARSPAWRAPVTSGRR